MLALTLALSVQLAAADARPEAWVVVSRRSGVAKPQALDFARALGKALNERGVPTPTPVEDASSCNAKVPCLVDLAQKKGVGVLVTVEAGSALDEVVLHVEALSVEEYGKKVGTFDFTGTAAGFNTGLKDKVEEFFAPAVRGVLGLGQVAAKPEPVVEKKPDPVVVTPKPEPVVEPVAPVVVAKQADGLSPVRIVGIAGMAVGGALLITSAVFGIRTLGFAGTKNSLCPADAACHDPAAFTAYNNGASSQNTSVALLVTGAVVAAAGAALFVLDMGNGSSATVTPAASGDGMGLVLSGAF